MPVDVEDLVDSLKRQINPPGVDLFPDAVDSIFAGHLSDAFWELTIAGYITGFTNTDGIITEDSATPTEELSAGYQQLMVIVAAMNILRMKMLDLNTVFRSKAGPVEFEQQKSANVLADLLKSLQAKYDAIVEGLPDSNITGSYIGYCDIINTRINYGDSFIGY